MTRDGVFTLYDVSGVAPGVLTFDIAAGPDGDMWFTGPDGLGRITPNGQASVVPVPGASVWKVTGGPDGNIWFTDRTGKIGRVTPRGDVKEFDLPAGQTPDAITTGNDGNLWFTEDFNPSRVGRISPTADITLFPFGAGGDRGLQDISPGVSDVVWVSETNVAAVGRVASDGSWKEFPLNFPRANSLRITLGSDGRMWFTDESKNRVGRIVLQRPPP